MSTQIEERVVQMKFDSKNFDQNVAETIKELNKFEAKLKLLGAQQGMKDVQKSVDSMDFNPLLSGADKVESRFDILSVAVIATINNMTNKVVDSAERLVKSLSIDQVTAGWDKYAEKTSAVQTIMAATAKNFSDTGEQMEFVNAELEKLNWFTDETSYSFLDMVNNIGKFTSNNIGLQESVTAMQGISTWAAVSGANVQEAGRAMYNLSQAMATGTVKLIDWKSIENANMATAEFKETVIETAAEMGLLVEKGEGIYGVKGKIDKTNVSVSNFNENLSDGWFTADVLMSTLNQYGQFASDLYRVTEQVGGTATDWLGWIDDFKAGTFDVDEAVMATQKDANSLLKTVELLSSDKYARGLKAFRAAQEAKTFAEAISSVKDAVSTGWMNTFEIIFGDYEKAKKLWTGLANELYDVFAEGGWQRNDILTEWAELGGRDDLFAGIAQGWRNIRDIIGAVKEAFDEMFPPMTGKRLAEITKLFLAFTKQVKLSNGSLTTLKNTCKLLLIPLRLVWEILKTGALVAAILAKEIVKLIDSFGSLVAGTKTVNNVFRDLFGDERYEAMVDRWADALDRLGAAFSTIGMRIDDALSKIQIKPEKSNKIQKFFQVLYDLLAPIASFSLELIVSGIEDLANIDFSKISDFANRSLTNLLENLKGIGGVTEKFATGIENFFNKIKSTSPEEALDSLVGVWYKILDFPKQAKGLLSMNTVYQSISEHASGLSNVFGNLSESMAKMLQRLSGGQVLLFGFGISLVNTLLSVSNIANIAQGALKGFSSILTNTGKLLGAWYDKIRYDRVRQLAAAILSLSVALLVLATVKPERLKSATLAMVELIAALGGIILMVSLLDKFVLKDSKTYAKLATSIASVAIAISLMVGMFSVLLLVPMEDVGKRLVVLGTLMGLLVLTAVGLNKMPKDITAKVTLTLIPFVWSIASLVNSIKVLGKMDPVSLLKGVVVLPVIMGELMLVAKAMSKLKAAKTGNLVALGLGVMVLGKALEVVGGLNTTKMLRGVLSMSAIMTELMLFAALIKKLENDATNVTKSMINLAVAISAMSLAVYLLGAIDTRTLLKGTLVVGGMIVLMGYFGKLMSSKYGGEHAASVGKSFVSMALAIDMLTLAIHYLGSLSLKTVLQGTLVVASLMGMFALIMLAAKSAKSGTASIVAITAALGMVIASVALLTLIPAEESMAAAKALSTVMASLALAIGASKLGGKQKIQGAIDTFVSLVAYLTAAIGAIALINEIGLNENIQEKVNALSTLLVALASSMLIINKTKTNRTNLETWAGLFVALGAMILLTGTTLAALNALPINETIFEKLAAFGLLMGGMTVAMYAIAPLAKIKINPTAVGSVLLSFIEVLGVSILIMSAISMVQAAFDKYGGDLNEFLSSGIPVLMTVGEGIGRFVGAMLGGIGAAATEIMSNSFPKIAKNLTKFSEEAKPFFDTMSEVDSSAAEGVWCAVECFAALTGADLLANITTLGGRLGSMVSLTEDLKDAAPNLKDFANDMKDVTPESLAGAQIIADLASGLAEGLKETSGGILAIFTGNKSLTGLASELKDAAPDLKEFAVAMADVKGNFKNAEKMVDVIKKFAEITPEQNGALQLLTGEKNFETFGSQLSSFAVSFSNFAMWMGSVKTDEAFDAAMAVADMIADFADKKVPTTGGILSWFEKQDLAVFGTQIERFGIAMSGFAKNLVDIPPELTEKADLLKAALDKVLDADWGETFFTSGVEVSNVIENLKVYLYGISRFAKQATEEKYDLNNIGASSISELVAGIESALPELKSLANTVPTILVVKAKDALGIQGKGSSSKFNEIGRYTIQGFTKGLQNQSDLSKLNEAAIAMASGVLEAVKEFNEIQSPSALYKREVGVFIVRGIAEGIKADMSAEEAAKQKAQNIVNAFKEALESSEIQLALKQAQYDLWTNSQGLNATQSEQNNMKAQNFVDRLEAQAEATKNAEGAYLAAVKTLGESHNETIKLQTEFLKAQNEGYKLAKEFADFNSSTKESMITARDAAREYYEYLASDEVKKMLEGGITQAEINAYATKKFGYEGSTNAKEYYDFMNSVDARKMVLEQGMTQEEVEAWAKEHFGYSAGRGLLTGLDETLTKGYNGMDVQSIYEHFFSGDVSVQVFADAEKKAGAAGVASGTAYVKGVDEGVSEGVNEFLDDPLGSIFENMLGADKGKETGFKTAANVLDGFNNTISSGGEAIRSAVSGAFGLGVEAINETFDTHSPSKVTEETAVWVIEGFVNGINKNSGAVETCMGDMAKAGLVAFTNGFGDGSDNNLPWNTQMYDAGGYFMKAFASGFSDSYDHLQLAFSTVIAKLLSAVIETHPNWRKNGFTCGSLMMQGIVDGVESGKAAAITAVVQAATDAYKAAVEALGFDVNMVGVGIVAKGVDEKDLRGFAPTTSKRAASTVAQGLKANTSSRLAGAVDQQIRSGGAGGKKSDSGTEKKQVNNYYTFNQTNNSPKAINSYESYRLQHSGLAVFKNEVRKTND